jgi:hypothetical protein
MIDRVHALVVGGSLDGQWREVNPNERTHRFFVPTPMPPPLLGSSPADPQLCQVEVQVCELEIFYDHTTDGRAYFFLREASTSLDDLFVSLTSSYHEHARLKRRRRGENV